MNPIEKSGKLAYGLIAYGRYLELTQISEYEVELSCEEEEFNQLWKSYFDLAYDYEMIVHNLIEGDDIFLKEAAAFGKGIRILQQEPFEAAISFIISQNKNIPAIKNCIEELCNHYGEKRLSKEGVEYRTFPTPEVLADAVKEDLRALKTGYRDEYIIRAAQAVAEGAINFEHLKLCSFEEAVIALKSIHGVGEKVANCIALYGLHHIEGFPVDVWILKVLKEIYNNDFHKELYQGYAGIVQQYMFYYMRNRKSNVASE
jgi:N-glycosylase/DNA lyase